MGRHAVGSGGCGERAADIERPYSELNCQSHILSERPFHAAMMTAVVNAYDNHMSMSEQVLKKDNVKAGLKDILKDLVYEAFAKGRTEVGAGASGREAG
jgi:hypothetical protein